MAEFPQFGQLPYELRLDIWTRVQPPQRLISILPCPRCWRHAEARHVVDEIEECTAASHPDFRLRWVCNSPSEAVFPLLHACKESRQIWETRYVRPPRYVDLDSDGLSPSRLRFDVPFLNYERDVFCYIEARSDYQISTREPLYGLDRRLVQHVAVPEYAWALTENVHVMSPQTLPSLRSVTILVYGPDPAPGHMEWPSKPAYGASFEEWPEMFPCDSQLHDCAMTDLSDQVVAQHPFYRHPRLRHTVFEPDPFLRNLKNYIMVFKAWLWHAEHWDKDAHRDITQNWWWDFYMYLYPTDHNDLAAQPCPMQGHEEWCPGQHSRDDLIAWEPRFSLKTALLMDRQGLRDMLDLEGMDVDETGMYANFDQFKRLWLDKRYQGPRPVNPVKERLSGRSLSYAQAAAHA